MRARFLNTQRRVLPSSPHRLHYSARCQWGATCQAHNPGSGYTSFKESSLHPLYRGAASKQARLQMSCLGYGVSRGAGHLTPTGVLPALGLSASQDPHRTSSGGLVGTDHLQMLPQVQVGGVLIGEGLQVGLQKDRAQ